MIGEHKRRAPPKEAGKLTDAEKIARFEHQPFLANAGKYELKGSTLTMNAMVAKSQETMTTRDKGHF